MAISPLSPDAFRAAAEAYHELGPEYSDAVAESFVEKINEEIEARVDAQLARAPHGLWSARSSKLDKRHSPMTGPAIGASLTGVPLALFLVVLMRGSAAVRADRYQWLLGVLLVSAVVSVAATIARKAQVRGACG